MLRAMSTPATHPPAAVYTDADYDAWIQQDPGRTVRIVRVLTEWFWDHVYRLQAHGIEHVPAEGPYILAPNHSSYADPFLHVRPIPRLVRFMAKSSMFEYPIMRTFARGGGAFPVRRGKGDAFAMELARRLLRAGQPVVMYPEGTRYRSSFELGPAKRGAARLALEVGVPIVPAATWGVKRRELYGRPRWRRPKATTVYGELLDFGDLEPTPENIDHVRDVVWTRVHELYEVARGLAEAR